MVRELERSHVVRCRGNSPALDLLEKPVDALLKVYKSGEVEVNCYYISDGGRCLHSKGGSKNCIYKE